jgi:PAS domain-containing protein
MKLSTKLTLSLLIITLVCGVATSAIVSSYMLKLLERERIETVNVIVRSLANQLADGVINQDPVSVREILQGVLSPHRGLDFAYLVDSKGNILAHTFEGKIPDSLTHVQSETLDRDGSQRFFRFKRGNTSYLISSYSLLEGEGLGKVYVGISSSVLYAHIRRITILIMSISLAVAVLGALAASYAAIRFTRPLKKLTGSIIAFGCGESIQPVIEEGGAEIKQLSSAFYKMVDSRDRAEASLRFQNALLEAQNATTLDGILIVSPERKVVYHNSRFLEIWSIPADQVTDLSEVLLASIPGQLEDHEAFLAKVRYLYAHPDEISLDELVFRDGRIIERYSAPVDDGAGNRYGRIWFFRDIT